MTLSPEEWCCGSPALRVGKRELFAEIAKHNSEAIKKAGIKRIVTSCAGCYRTLKIDYPEFVGKLPVEIVHTSELLANLIKDGRLKLKGVISETVTYHDPCHLGRHCGVYEPPRDVLKSIQGITYVELPRNRQSAWCCGAGGGVKSGYPDFALWTAKDRLKEVEVAGAKALVSTCPFCATNFKDTIKDTTSKLKFYDLTELVLKALQ
jgi:heterodisulfide reductase subunit D